MRIGLITHNYPATTTERKDAGIFLYDFAQELSKKHDVFVLTPSFEGKKEKFKNVPVTYFSWRGGKSKLGEFKITSPTSAIQFVSLIKEGRTATVNFVNKNQIDFLIAAWAFPSGDFAHFAHQKTNVPYAVWTLGSDMNKYIRYPILKQLITQSLKTADFRFANSQALVRKVQQVTGRSCNFLPAVTNLLAAKTPVTKPKNTPFTFLFVGRLESVKGPDILLDAIERLPSGNWQVKVGGDGTLERKLKAQAEKSVHPNKIQFLGRLDGQQVITHMQQADCLVVPSRNESLPLVIIEAARAGLPVIASNVGDCNHIIEQYRVGFVVKPEDSESLARKMKKVLETKGFKKRFQKGTQELSADYTQVKVVAQFNNYVKAKN